MLSDFSYVIIIPTLLIISNATLNSINMKNKIIMLTVFFLLIHLYASNLFKWQLKALRQDNRVLTNSEIASFVGFVIALITIGMYILVSLIPSIKILIRPITGLIGLSDYYNDLLLIIIPVIISNYISRKIVIHA